METKCFLVRVSTGCTCCSNENFIQGPYLEKEAAEACADTHKRHRTLSSQYAADGCQELLEVPYEIAGDWIILDNRYAVKGSFTDPENTVFPESLDMFARDWRL